MGSVGTNHISFRYLSYEYMHVYIFFGNAICPEMFVFRQFLDKVIYNVILGIYHCVNLYQLIKHISNIRQDKVDQSVVAKSMKLRLFPLHTFLFRSIFVNFFLLSLFSVHSCIFISIFSRFVVISTSIIAFFF